MSSTSCHVGRAGRARPAAPAARRAAAARTRRGRCAPRPARPLASTRSCRPISALGAVARRGCGRRRARRSCCAALRRRRAARTFAQPLVQPRAHLAGGLAREGDGQDLLRLRAVEQRAQDARHQHPGLAGAGAGLDDDAAPRVAGDARRSASRATRRAVERVGRRVTQCARPPVVATNGRAGTGRAPRSSRRRALAERRQAGAGAQRAPGRRPGRRPAARAVRDVGVLDGLAARSRSSSAR